MKDPWDNYIYLTSDENAGKRWSRIWTDVFKEAQLTGLQDMSRVCIAYYSNRRKKASKKPAVLPGMPPNAT